jgi:hypothetical protein
MGAGIRMLGVLKLGACPHVRESLVSVIIFNFQLEGGETALPSGETVGTQAQGSGEKRGIVVLNVAIGQRNSGTVGAPLTRMLFVLWEATGDAKSCWLSFGVYASVPPRKGLFKSSRVSGPPICCSS